LHLSFELLGRGLNYVCIDYVGMRLRRYFIRRREGRRLLEGFASEVGFSAEELFGGKVAVEVVEESNVKVYMVGGEARLVEVHGRVVPALTFRKVVDALPRVVVDMGAIPHITNGADVMAPGVVRVDGDFKPESLVAVVDERHGKAVAIGSALLSSGDMAKAERGRVVKNLHYVGDRAWKLIKHLS